MWECPTLHKDTSYSKGTWENVQHQTKTQVKVKEHNRMSNITQIKVKEHERLSNITLRHKLK